MYKNNRREIFKSEDFFMLRCPLLSANDYEELFINDVEKTYDKIFSIIENNSVVRESILISSNNLYKDIKNKWKILKYTI